MLDAKRRHLTIKADTHTQTQNKELIDFSEAGCSPSESLKFLSSVKSSQRGDKDTHGHREGGKDR